MTAPWEQLSVDRYRSTHNPAFVLAETTFRCWALINDTTGESWPIAGDHGLYYALDVAEAVVLGGIEGTHDRNILRADER